MSNRGKKVKVHYIGTLDDGSQFDSSFDRDEPIEFTCMSGQMIPGFDAAVDGMQPGETRQVHIPAAEAYGVYNPLLRRNLPIGQIPGLETAPIGETIYLSGAGGQPTAATVIKVTESSVLIDTNHQLAGKDLNFEISLIEVEERK